MSAPNIFNSIAPRIFSIDQGRPFVTDLAAVLRQTAGEDPAALAEMTIFVPTRRAARALSEAFIASAASRAILLPSIRPLGDAEEDVVLMHAPERDFTLPPAISTLERLLVLANFVAAADRTFSGQENWPAALSAAKELAGLLDSLYTEEIPFGRLGALAPAELARHWERSLQFLSIVVRAWPDYLLARGLTDPTDRRAQLISRYADHLERRPPQKPVLVAGSTGSAPAVARLMRAVAALPKGAVVLPGLDRGLDLRAWDAIEDPHPQAGLKALLQSLHISPAAVESWPLSGTVSARAQLLSLALRPAEATDDWLIHVQNAARIDPGLERSTEGLMLIEARDEEAEAAAIALLLRETIEVPAATAMLVTPDRNLARRVATKMRRWDVIVDDSGGVPFANTPCGAFLRLLAAWLIAPSDSVALLALAKSRLAGFGLDPSARASAINALDRGLRGAPPVDGIGGLKLKLRKRNGEIAGAPIAVQMEAALAFWPTFARAPFADLLAAHLSAAELLACDEEQAGAVRLWRGEDGEAGSLLLSEISAVAQALGEIAVADYEAAFAQLIATASVRRPGGAHPRISILGPLEARLQSADHVVLAGLNEGVWPDEAAADPFLSRDMRKKAGLPSPERRIGLAAHDFAQLAAAGRVTLTRARMTGGSPARPSRWIVRLKNILAGAGANARMDATARYADWSRALDAPDIVRRNNAPAPRPPYGARPRALFVTEFEQLLRDPYAVYAKNILRLKPLDPVAEAFGYRQLGSLLHAMMQDFLAGGEDPSAQGARAAMTDLLETQMQAMGLVGGDAALWRARLDASIDWLLSWDCERRRLGIPAAIEAEGSAVFDVGAAPFTLSARADRVDRLHDGGAAIFDYKAGDLPTLDQVNAKFNPQLPLTALILLKGGFAEVQGISNVSFHYVKAVNQKNVAKDQVGATGADAEEFVRQAREGFAALVAAFDDPQTPYLSQPRPQFRNKFGKYDRLARRREWASEEEGEDGE